MSDNESDLPPPDTICAVCNDQCMYESLKCQKCKRYVHTDCSNLPAYAIVNFFKSRCQYTCEGCVLKNHGEHSDRFITQVLSLIENEKEKKMAKYKNIACGGHDDPEPTESNKRDVPNQEQDNSATEPGARNNILQHGKASKQSTICFFYKNHKCKFGRSGRDCPYAHPSVCFKYKMNGCDSQRGCKKGDQCNYLHPPICNGSARKRECLNSECKRLHLKGTRRYPPSNIAAGPQSTANYQRNPQSTQAIKNSQPQTKWINPSNVEQSEPMLPFLVKQMQEMQHVQQQMLQVLQQLPWKPLPIPLPPGFQPQLNSMAMR